MEYKHIDLCVSAERSMLLIVRMTTAGVMSRVGLTLDEMDDMKMAIDEACNLMMLQKPGCQSLEIHYEYSDSVVHVRIKGQGTAAEQTGVQTSDSSMQEVIYCILETMVDEVEMTPRADGGTLEIHLTKNVPDRRRSAV